MKHITKMATGAAGLGLTLFAALPAWAQDAALQAPPAAATAATVNKATPPGCSPRPCWS